MYFPYLRGKQFELLALKELSSRIGDCGRVVPIIEPVKKPDGGLRRCVDALRGSGVEPIIIVNPTVGDIRTASIPPAVISFVNEYRALPLSSLGVLVSDATDVDATLEAYQQHFDIGVHDLTLVHIGQAGSLQDLRDATDKLHRVNDLVSDELRRRHYLPFFEKSRGIVLHDGFVPEERNSDYLPRVEGMFSEDILYYKEEGWGGFADYLTIGKGWTDGGFTPRAVAIHWTYQPSDDSPIMIRHFTSTSNDSIANVAGKFLEAARKLVEFLDTHDIQTMAAGVMRQHVSDDTYPGLGIVKKLSIQNHLELVADILDREQ